MNIVDVVVGDDGTIYFADGNNDKVIYKVNEDGTYSELAYGFQRISDIAVDSLSNVYVADLSTGSITKITPEGIKSTLGTELGEVSGVDVDSNGNVYFVDYSGTISKIDTDENISTFVTSENNAYIDVVVDNNDNVYASGFIDGPMGIKKYTSEGTLTSTIETEEIPYDFVVSDDGSIYFQYDDNKIVHYDAYGDVQGSITDDSFMMLGAFSFAPNGTLYIVDDSVIKKSKQTIVLSGTPSDADVGMHTVTLSVDDGITQTEHSFELEVSNVNDIPVFDTNGFGFGEVDFNVEMQTQLNEWSDEGNGVYRSPDINDYGSVSYRMLATSNEMLTLVLIGLYLLKIGLTIYIFMLMEVKCYKKVVKIQECFQQS